MQGTSVLGLLQPWGQPVGECPYPLWSRPGLGVVLATLDLLPCHSEPVSTCGCHDDSVWTVGDYYDLRTCGLRTPCLRPSP